MFRALEVLLALASVVVGTIGLAYDVRASEPPKAEPPPTTTAVGTADSESDVVIDDLTVDIGGIEVLAAGGGTATNEQGESFLIRAFDRFTDPEFINALTSVIETGADSFLSPELAASIIDNLAEHVIGPVLDNLTTAEAGNIQVGSEASSQIVVNVFDALSGERFTQQEISFIAATVAEAIVQQFGADSGFGPGAQTATIIIVNEADGTTTMATMD